MTSGCDNNTKNPWQGVFSHPKNLPALIEMAPINDIDALLESLLTALIEPAAADRGGNPNVSRRSPQDPCEN